jgi:hypothetical protein
MPDTEKQREEQEAVLSRLPRLGEQRAQAKEELASLRAELRDLLARGQAAELDVSNMARAAGISRETAHLLLREARSKSQRDRKG